MARRATAYRKKGGEVAGRALKRAPRRRAVVATSTVPRLRVHDATADVGNTTAAASDPAPVAKPPKIPTVLFVDEEGWMTISGGKPLRVEVDPGTEGWYVVPVSASATVRPRRGKVRAHKAPAPKAVDAGPSRFVVLKEGASRRYHISLDTSTFTRTHKDADRHGPAIVHTHNRVADTVPGELGNTPDGRRFVSVLRTAPGFSYADVAAGRADFDAPRRIRGARGKKQPGQTPAAAIGGSGSAPAARAPPPPPGRGQRRVFNIPKAAAPARAPFKKDLTEEGIEPNPGPCPGALLAGLEAHHFYRAPATLSWVDAAQGQLAAFSAAVAGTVLPAASALGSGVSSVSASIASVGYDAGRLVGSGASTISSSVAIVGAGAGRWCSGFVGYFAGLHPSHGRSWARALTYAIAGGVVIGGVYYATTEHCGATIGYLRAVYARYRFIRAPDFSDEELAAAIALRSADGSLTTPATSLRATVAARARPLPLLTAASVEHALARAWYGGRCLVSVAHAPPIVSEAAFQLRRVGSGVAFHGTTAFRGETSDVLPAGPVPAEIQLTSWIGAVCRVTARPVVLPTFEGLEAIVTYDIRPGPWHICKGCCVPAPAFEPPVEPQRFGNVFLTHSGGDTHVCWADYSGICVVPSALVHDAVTRWSLHNKHTSFATLGVTLNEHRDAIAPMMEAVANGYRVKAPHAATSYSVECVVSDLDTVDPDRAQSITSVHNPLLPSSKLVPGGGLATLLSSLKSRVHQPPTRISTTVETTRAMHDFAEQLLRNTRLYALGYEEMSEHMQRPTQRQELADLATRFDLKTHKWSIFCKTEPSSSHARIIAASQGTQNYEFARYTLPLSAHLQDLPFWAPGKACGTIQSAVLRLHEIAAAAGRPVSEYDYARFDGTTGTYGASLLRIMLSMAYGADRGWEEPLSNTLLQNARVPGGVGAASMGIGTLSGSADTTLRNTLLNGFIIYYQAVLAGLSPADAYRALCSSCLVSGDDSLVIEINGGMPIAATICGLSLEGRSYDIGPTRFLGRFYPDPWSSSSNIADVPRWLSRVHLVSVPAGKSTESAMAQKALGHLVNDPDTPLVSDYAKAVLKLYPTDTLCSMYFDPWKLAQLTATGSGAQYTNTDFNDDDLMVAIAKDMGCDITVLQSLRSELSTLEPRVGTQYTAMGPLVIKPIPGLVVNGVPYSPPSARPAYKVTLAERKKEKLALAVSFALADEALASLDVPVNPAPPSAVGGAISAVAATAAPSTPTASEGTQDSCHHCGGQHHHSACSTIEAGFSQDACSICGAEHSTSECPLCPDCQQHDCYCLTAAPSAVDDRPARGKRGGRKSKKRGKSNATRGGAGGGQ